jgi:hypothetical protein
MFGLGRGAPGTPPLRAAGAPVPNGLLPGRGAGRGAPVPNGLLPGRGAGLGAGR